MSARAKPSPWASKVFGRRIGNLDVGVPPPVESIKNENRKKFDVVFVRSPGWHDPSARVTALDYLYDMEQVTPFGGLRPRSDVIRINSFNPRQLRIARTAFLESRFLRDPLLERKAPDMYVRWLAESGAYVLAEEPNSGFLTVTKDPDGCRRISLMAVADGKRGAGVGRRLAWSVLSEKAPDVWRVKVSARNYHAVRFYETVGFLVKDVWTAFHVWIGKGW